MYPPREGNGLWDEQQVISQPEVHSIELTNDDNFLILACDGVWDVLTNQEAISYVHRRLLTHRDVQRAAVELIDKVLLLVSPLVLGAPCKGGRFFQRIPSLVRVSYGYDPNPSSFATKRTHSLRLSNFPKPVSQ